MRSQVWKSGGWLALAVLAQAAALQLMNAGPVVGYQHYPPLSDLLEAGNILWLLVLLVQAVAVSLAIRSRGRGEWSWMGDLGPRRLATFFLIFFFTSAALSRAPATYAGELVFATVVQLLALGTIALAVLALPLEAVEAAGRRIEGVFGGETSPRAPAAGGIDRFAIGCAAWVVLVTALLSYFSYERHPHVPDEVAYLKHAQYFARGLLWMAPPPVPEAFDLDLMTFEPARWYSPVPPGWPAVLALGALLGVPWLINPILAAINILLAYVFVRELYDRYTARMSTLLLSASPWLLFMGMNFMTHTVTLTAALAAAVCVARMRGRSQLLWVLPAGVATGFLALVRPLEAVIVALLLGVWALFGEARRLHPARAALLAVVSISTAAVTLPYNRMFTGRATYFPLLAYTDAQYGAGTNALGFGPQRGLGWTGLDPFPGHGAADVLVNAALNGYQVNVELFGWATGSIVLIALFLLSPARAWRRADLAMTAVILTVVGAHTFYWFSGGPDFGARYWFLIIVPAVVLSVRGLQWLGARSEHGRTRANLAVLGLTTAAVVTFIPWRAVDKYHHYRGMRPDVRRLAAVHDFAGALVLIRGHRHPDYASAATYNPIDLRGEAAIYAWDRGPAVHREVLLAYSDRPVWIVEGPTLTGVGYRVARGPVSAAKLLSEMDARNQP